MVSYRARVAGIYRARYEGTSERKLVDEQTGEDIYKWLWRFQEPNDPTTVGEISKWTGTDPKSPNSNAHKMLAGIMGRKPQDGDDTDTMIGRLYDVVYGPNQAGNLTITSVVLVAEGPTAVQEAPVAPVAVEVAPEGAAAPAAAPAASVVADPNDDLPF